MLYRSREPVPRIPALWYPGPVFSRRLPGDFRANLLSERVAQFRASGRLLHDLTESNPTRVGLGWKEQDLRAALDASGIASYDPDPRGLLLARQAVSAYYAERGTSVPPERIVLTASTSESYAHLFRVLGDPGDEFLVPAPSYPLFESLADLEAVRVVSYPLRGEDEWRVDFAALRAAMTPRTRGIIVVNPNNPTGSILGDDEADALAVLAAEAGLPLLVDEVFADFPAPGEHVRSFASRRGALIFVLSGLSKTAALPQLKLGWIAVSGPESAAGQALERLEWVSDSFLSVAGPVQRALPGLLGGRNVVVDRIRERVNGNERRLRDHLGKSGAIRVMSRRGGWTAVLRVPRVRSEEAWCLELLERGVFVHPGHFYDFPEETWLVLSLLPVPEVFIAGAEAICALKP